MTFEEDDSNWMDGYEVSDIVVKDLDLMTALDYLDRIDSSIMPGLG